MARRRNCRPWFFAIVIAFVILLVSQDGCGDGECSSPSAPDTTRIRDNCWTFTVANEVDGTPASVTLRGCVDVWGVNYEILKIERETAPSCTTFTVTNTTDSDVGPCFFATTFRVCVDDQGLTYNVLRAQSSCNHCGSVPCEPRTPRKHLGPPLAGREVFPEAHQ